MTSIREKEQFLRFLRDRGQRVTGERLALFDEIFSHHDHIDAEALLEAMKSRGLKISRATVYRNLDLLVESGPARSAAACAPARTPPAGRDCGRPWRARS